MHVCVLLNNDFTHDNRVKREVIALANNGYRVSLFAVKSKKTEVAERELLCNGRVIIRRILPQPLSSFRPFHKQLKKAVLSILYKYGRFNVIHAHDANMLPLGYCLSKIHFCKLIYDSHEYWRATFDSRLEQLAQLSKEKGGGYVKDIKRVEQFIRFEEKVLASCSAIISVSPSITQMLAKKSGKPNIPVITLRNICEKAQNYHPHLKQRFHEFFELPKDTKVLLYQGGITKARGIPELLQMMESLKRSDIVLVLMGSIGSTFLSEFNQLLAEVFHKKGNVFYKEAVPSDELLSWTASADLGIHPILNHNLNHYYCLPNKVFEYLQAGIPQAVSELPELGTLVKGYKIGFTFEAGNVEAMKDKVEYYFSTQGACESFSNAIQEAKNILNWENEQLKLIELYKMLLPLPSKYALN